MACSYTWVSPGTHTDTGIIIGPEILHQCTSNSCALSGTSYSGVTIKCLLYINVSNSCYDDIQLIPMTLTETTSIFPCAGSKWLIGTKLTVNRKPVFSDNIIVDFHKMAMVRETQHIAMPSIHLLLLPVWTSTDVALFAPASNRRTPQPHVLQRQRHLFCCLSSLNVPYLNK